MPRLLPARRPNVSDEMIQAARLGRLFPELNPESEWPDSWKRVAFRDAAQLPMVPLGPSRPIDMVDLLLRHESSRELRPDPLLAEPVPTLMSAVAISRSGSTADFAESRRTYPSGGARYPIDVYLLVLRCHGIDPGAYMFDPRPFALRQIERRDFFGEVRSVRRTLGRVLESRCVFRSPVGEEPNEVRRPRLPARAYRSGAHGSESDSRREPTGPSELPHRRLLGAEGRGPLPSRDARGNADIFASYRMGGGRAAWPEAARLRARDCEMTWRSSSREIGCSRISATTRTNSR